MIVEHTPGLILYLKQSPHLDMSTGKSSYWQSTGVQSTGGHTPHSNVPFTHVLRHLDMNLAYEHLRVSRQIDELIELKL